MRTHRWQDIKNEGLSEEQKARVRVQAALPAILRPPIVRSLNYWLIAHVPGYWRLALWWSRRQMRRRLLVVELCGVCGGRHASLEEAGAVHGERLP